MYLHIKENQTDRSILPPVLAILLTPTSSNYSYLEHIFIVPKVFEPLKFDYKFLDIRGIGRIFMIDHGKV